LPFKKEVEEWQSKCLKFRLEPYKVEQIGIAVAEAKDFLLRYDKFLGIDAIKSEWS
jgi:hypothetical protein